MSVFKNAKATEAPHHEDAIYIIELSQMPGAWEVFGSHYFRTEEAAQKLADELDDKYNKHMKKGWGVRVNAMLPRGDEFEIEVQHAMDMLCDCIPYDDPDYHNKLRKMAEGAVRNIHTLPHTTKH